MAEAAVAPKAEPATPAPAADPKAAAIPAAAPAPAAEPAAPAAEGQEQQCRDGAIEREILQGAPVKLPVLLPVQWAAQRRHHASRC